MEKRNKRYPIGVDSFEMMRSDNYVYVDKTQYVYDLTHQYNYVFLARPRRFGKSLLVSTLEAYFKGRKELFKGLAMEHLETEWAQHPVFRFDMSRAKRDSIEELRDKLNFFICEYEEIYGRCSYSNDVTSRLEWLMKEAHRQTGRKVVLLIDEYDSPILNVMHDKQKKEDFKILLRSFYAPIKACGEHIRFGFITGISQLSIFSEINNLARISMVDQWSGICGITETELHNNLEDEINDLAEYVGITKDEALVKLKTLYDGYHFSKNSEDIYNPFSLVTALNNKDIGSYWFETATPHWLIGKLNEAEFEIEDLEETVCKQGDFDMPVENMKNVLPLLYQSGYLTIKSYDKAKEKYLLGYPNNEVRNGMLTSFFPNYLGEGKSVLLVEDLGEYLKNGETSKMLRNLRSLFAGMLYYITSKTERHFQAMFYLIFKLMVNAKVKSEVSSARGRVDAVVETNDAVYIFEFKLDKSAEKALAQIEKKGYAVPYETDARRVLKIGANFDSEKKTLTEWIIDENGSRTVWNEEKGDEDDDD